jgi:hypothetical protein
MELMQAVNVEVEKEINDGKTLEEVQEGLPKVFDVKGSRVVEGSRHESTTDQKIPNRRYSCPQISPATPERNRTRYPRRFRCR